MTTEPLDLDAVRARSDLAVHIPMVERAAKIQAICDSAIDVPRLCDELETARADIVARDVTIKELTTRREG